MESQIYLDAFDAEGSRMLEVAEQSLTSPVPSCPGWDVGDLLTHVGRVYGRVSGLVAAAGSTERPEFTDVDPPADRNEVAEWVRGLHQRLSTLLRSIDPETPAWNWAGTGKAGFFARRMAHETVLHRWDVEQTAGAATPIDTDMATDGVDELIEVALQHSTNPDKEYLFPAGSLHLHRTDGDGEWLLRAEGGKLVATHEHAKGDAAVRGSGDNLFLFMWGRPAQGLEIFGDESVAQAWSQLSP